MTIEAFSDHGKLPVKPGDRITAEYTDHTLPAPDTTLDELIIMDTATIDSSSPESPVANVSITFDKSIYSWTDTVTVTIILPDANTDSTAIDRVGEGGFGQLRVATSRSNLHDLSFVETAPDSGTFVGQLTLSGFEHDADGNQNTGDENGNDTNPQTDSAAGQLENTHDDHFSVSILFNGQRVISAAPITWNAGIVTWLEDEYSSASTGIVEIVDPDMNLFSDRIDQVQISVWSDTDLSGRTLMVEETGVSTGLFRAEIQFTSSAISNENKIRVTSGDTISARYRDYTLPPPNRLVDHISITGITRISDTVIQPPGSGSSITLDQAEYTWTDKVLITVTSPTHDANPNQVDEIGATESDRIRITTRDHELDFYR